MCLVKLICTVYIEHQVVPVVNMNLIRIQKNANLDLSLDRGTITQLGRLLSGHLEDYSELHLFEKKWALNVSLNLK